MLKEMSRLIAEGRPFAIVTLVDRAGSSPRDVGAKMLVLPDGSTVGSIGGGCVESGAVGEALEVLRTRRPKLVELDLVDESRGGVGMECGGSIRLYIEPVLPPPKLLIVGCGHVGRQLAELGKRVGFRVTVVDPATSQNEMEGICVIQKPIKEIAGELEVDEDTYIVIASRHKGDEEALRALTGSPARYIGWLASKARVRTTFEKLEREGISREALDRVHAPVGLDIGAETPAEIAVSIMAEIIKIMRDPGASGRSLKELAKKQSDHQPPGERSRPHPRP